MSKDYYKILGIEKTASEDDIKRAYRKLAHQYHPDKSGGSEAKFKEINEAYQILSNKEKRSQYDGFGRTFSSGGPSSGGDNPFGWDFRTFSQEDGGGFEFGFDPRNFSGEGGPGGFEGLNDIFDAFFERMGVKKRKTYKRGADMEVHQEISLEESFKGVSKKITVKTLKKCADCGGLGYDEKAGADKCSVCEGRGEVRESRNTFFGNFSQVRSCSKCFGTGQIPKKPCSVCAGAGRVKNERELVINILSGIGDGQIIKVSGGGEAGERGAGDGDLYVRVRVRPHQVFERHGDDLYIKKEANLLDVLLEKEIEIPNIEGGKMRAKIPSGWDLKENLKISGEGMPRLGTRHRGDFYIVLSVKTPKKLSAKAKKLLEDLDKEI